MTKFSKKVRQFYNLYWEEYAEIHRKSLTENKVIKPAVLRILGDVEQKQILDIGCGTGTYIVEYAKQGANVMAIDISEKLLEVARKSCKGLSIRFREGDILEMKLPKERFDIVTAILVTGHINNLNKFFSRILRLLKPNGLLVVTYSHPYGRGVYIKPDTKKRVRQKDIRRSMELLSDWGDGILAPVIKRSLSDCLNPLFKAGFCMTEVEEPGVLLVGARPVNKI